MAGTGMRNGLSSFIRNLPEGIVSYESSGNQRRFFRTNWGGESHGPIQSDREMIRDDFQKGPAADNGFVQGDRVRHPAFGAGVVSKSVTDNKIEVVFAEAGRKLLNLEYTTLEKM